MQSFYRLLPSAKFSPVGCAVMHFTHSHTVEHIQVESDHWHDFIEPMLHFKVLESHHCRRMIDYSKMSDCYQRWLLQTCITDCRMILLLGNRRYASQSYYRCSISGSCQVYCSAVRKPVTSVSTQETLYFSVFICPPSFHVFHNVYRQGE